LLGDATVEFDTLVVMRRLRSRVISTAIVAGSIITACKYTAPADSPIDGTVDTPIDDPPPPCTGAEITCVGEGTNQSLRVCEAGNPDPTTTACPWGCTTAGTAHCLLLQPSGGAVTADDLVEVPGQDLASPTIVAPGQIDTDDGSIDGVRGSGPGVVDGIEFVVRNNVAIFRFQTLTIDAPVQVRGANAVALVALDGMTINAPIDVQGGCSGTNPGPGGFRGGSAQTAGQGPGSGAGGVGADDNSSAGGGGGYGGGGGSGGSGNSQAVTSGGTAFGDATITQLRGGGGGGGGGTPNGGVGGGGGGAIQLASNGPITFAVVGGINAGGCGGAVGGDKHAGGGGGAGGAILIEGVTVKLGATCVLAVNGGGGGGGDNTGEGATSGEDAKLGLSQAQGGNNGNKGGDGGDGAADDELAGQNGSGAENGGGGGGGAGWLRVNTFAGAASIDSGAVISPQLAPGLPNSTASQGSGVTQ
jgi:hypothetical protein